MPNILEENNFSKLGALSWRCKISSRACVLCVLCVMAAKTIQKKLILKKKNQQTTKKQPQLTSPTTSCLPVPSAVNLCNQFGPRSGRTKCRASIGPNCLTLWSYCKRVRKKMILKKINRRREKLTSIQRVNIHLGMIVEIEHVLFFCQFVGLCQVVIALVSYILSGDFWVTSWALFGRVYYPACKYSKTCLKWPLRDRQNKGLKDIW